jgi:hypothetical protein
MPRGGRRAGSGRKKGSRNKRVFKAVADTIAASGRTPLAYMLQVMEDVSVDPVRRDEMARAAAVYCHPRLSSITTSNTNTNTNYNSDAIVQIFAVPRGGRVDTKDGTITIDGEAIELKPIEPFTGTPALSDLRDHNDQRAEREPVVERLEVTEIDTTNITVLRRRDEDQGPGAA